MSSGKSQRVMDPIYGLIVFDGNETHKNLWADIDRTAWDLIGTPEFQRLRRIRQLGFSEFVFPGATHSRFSHSIGVFHNARRLLKVVEKQKGSLSEDRAFETCIAALLHDVGHGPFSHTFEKVQKKFGVGRKHEDWTAEIIQNETGKIFEILGPQNSKKIAQSLKRKDPADVYDSVVASQFDADRLDYLIRDRHNTGVGLGGFDLPWLLDSIRVGKIKTQHDPDDDIVEVDGLYLSEKGLVAAEGYLLARYHMYEQVYLHKTTRCLEAMLATLLTRTKQLVDEKGIKSLNPVADGVAAKFLSGEKLAASDYLHLNDNLILHLVQRLSDFDTHKNIKQLARRLMNRDLFKCIDLKRISRNWSQDDEQMRFKKFIQDYKNEHPDFEILKDYPKLSAYKLHGYDEPGAF